MIPRIGYITDFGIRGMHYVAEMKGVAWQINPELQFLDISHTITPYAILEAAYTLKVTIPMLPSDIIVVCVVDPGVGSERDIVIVQLKSGHRIIGPDNGIFSYFVTGNQIENVFSITEGEFFFSPPDPATNSKSNADDTPSLSSIDEDMVKLAASSQLDVSQIALLNTAISTTFHGRDVMTPVAAHLSKGLDPLAVGTLKAIDDLVLLPVLEPEFHPEEQRLDALIQYIDSFGNCITNIPTQQFDSLTNGRKALFIMYWKGKQHTLFRSSYYAGNDENQLLLIEGSSGYLEISLNRGDASKELEAHVGNTLVIDVHGAEIPTFGSEMNLPGY
jgi:S-adenosylmethionine hydrolase